MGTSSTRRGKITSKSNSSSIDTSWRAAKVMSTKFFNGKGSFGGAFQRVISASGGSAHFATSSRTKIVKATIRLLGVFVSAKSIGIINALIKDNYKYDDSKTVRENIIDYLNLEICPDSTSYEDTNVRESIFEFSIETFSALFDEQGLFAVENAFADDFIKKQTINLITRMLETAFENEVPFSMETDNPEMVVYQIEKAKSELRDKAEKYIDENPFVIGTPIENDEYINKLITDILSQFENGEYDE